MTTTENEPYLTLGARGIKFAVTSDQTVAMGFHYDLSGGRGLRLSLILSPLEARKIAFLLLKNADKAMGIKRVSN
jgi:hypothetical protein